MKTPNDLHVFLQLSQLLLCSLEDVVIFTDCKPEVVFCLFLVGFGVEFGGRDRSDSDLLD